MADLATLGLAVDSSQVKSATKDLDSFSKSANSAADAAQKTSDAAGKGKDPVKAFASAFKDADANQGSYTKGANKVIDSLANQYVRLNTNARQWAQLSAIQKAGVDINSDAADKIAKMAGALFDMQEAQKASSKAANDNGKFVNGLAQGIAGALTPARLLGYALTALSTAATIYYTYQQMTAPSLETSLKEQARLVGLVKDAYRDATKTAGEFYRESKNVVDLQLQQNLIELRRKLAEETAKFATMSTQPVYDQLGNATGMTETVIADRYKAFKQAFDLIEGGANGSAEAIRKFREMVAGISGSNPEFAAAANELLNFSQKLSDLSNAIKDSESASRINKGKGTVEDRGRLGLPQDKTAENLASAWDKQLASLSRRNAAMEAEARTVGQSDAAHEKMRTTLLLEDFLYNKGIKNIDAYREQIAKAGDEAAKTAEKLARARINDQIGFDRNTAFLTPEDVQIASQLKAIYGNDIHAALSSTEAAAMRAANGMRELSSLGQDVNRGLLVEFGQQLRNGASAWDAFKNAGVNALGKIADKLMSMAADNLWKAAFGGSTGGLGGLLGVLFGLGGAGVGETSAVAGASSFMMGGQSFPKFANGGTLGAGWGIVGERGPELINVHSRGVTVIPNHVSRPYLPGFAEGGMLNAGGNVTRLPFGQNNNQAQTQIINNYDFRGADPSMKGWIKAQIKISQDQTLKATPGYTAKVNRDQPGMRRSG